MSTIVTRSGKGSPLSHVEVDANFTNLNTDKTEKANNLSDLTSASTARTNLGLVIGTDVLSPSGSGASLTSLNATNISSGTLAAARLPALVGDASSSAGSSTLTLATVNSNTGSFGSTTSVPVITVNGKGLITAVSTATISAGSGTVTSVAATVPSFLSITGSPITTSGTLAISYSGTALPVANGGTGVTTSTGSGANVLGTSPTVTNPSLGGATSGSIILAVPAIAGTNTATFPAATGTVMVSGNQPTFCAYRSGSTQSISQNTWTKVQFQTEQFDTASAYDNATNYRFTPLVSGYYQVNLSIGLSFDTLPPSNIYISLYKNGSTYRTGQIISSNPYGTITLSDVVYFNGSTDYVEGYAYSNSASAVVLYQTNNIAAPFCTFFSATLVRSA